MSERIGSEVVVKFFVADHDPDRAARTVQDLLEPVFVRAPVLAATPLIIRFGKNRGGAPWGER